MMTMLWTQTGGCSHLLFFSSRMKKTSFLLVFGLVLSFCLAQVSTTDKSYDSRGVLVRAPLVFGSSDSVFIHRLQSETGAEQTAAEEEHVELFTTPQTKMGAATSDFGYNLFRALANRETAANIFLAPISVSAALTQLSLGDHTHMQ